MFEKIENLEKMIDRVSATIQSLKDEKNQIAEELEIVKEVLDEKEKETASLREERELLEQRLSVLLDRMKAAYGISGGSSGWKDPAPRDDDPETAADPEHDTSRDEAAIRQGELSDRF